MIFKNKIPLTSEERNIRKKERLLLILSGVMMGLSLPPFPFPFQLLMFVGLIPYFFVISKKEKLGDINRSSYLMLFVFCLITIYWVGSWQAKADTFLLISGALLLFVNPAILLIASTIYFFSKKVFRPSIVIYFFPFFWVTNEYLYMITEASFPWLTLGNGLSYFTSFIQIADIIGAQGLSFVVVLTNVLLYKFIVNLKKNKTSAITHLSIASLIFIMIIVYGNIRLNTFELSERKVKIGIIQPDLDPWEKWELGGIRELSDLYLSLSEKVIDENTALILWPETALPVYLLDGAYRTTLEEIYSFLIEKNVYLLTGLPDVIYHDMDDVPPDAKYSETGDYYYSTHNAIVLLSPHTNEVQRYGKMKLVPFGERAPFVDAIPFLGDFMRWGVGLSGWNIGREKTIFKIPLYDIHGRIDDTLKVNGLVCYESIYPDFVSEFVNNGAELIAVVTNDSWYGNSSGPYQHKEKSILRAVENRRSVIRSANGGISCVINPLGITEYETKMFTKEAFAAEVVLQNEKTFYTQNPLIFPVLSSLFSLWIFGINLLSRVKAKFKL